MPVMFNDPTSHPVHITAAEADAIVATRQALRRAAQWPVTTAPAAPPAVSRRLRVLEWVGCGLGVAGAAMLAMNVELSRYGWLAFFAANVAMIAFARGINARGLLAQQVTFMLTSFLGIYRSFDTVHAGCETILQALGLH